jgi:hypothetical protein
MAELENDDKLVLFEKQTKMLETVMDAEVAHWDNIIKTLTNGIKGNIKNLTEVEAEVVNYKQLIDADIRKYALMMYKDNAQLKPLKKKRFEFYSTNYQIKLKNSSDIRPLIEADIAKIQYKIELLEAHIGFLRDTSSNLKTMTYSFKNRIELLNILGLD